MIVMVNGAKNLRIVFLGTSNFAVEALKKLVELKFQIVGVVTNPDKPSGRGQKKLPSPVKIYAKKVNLSLLQPVDFTSSDFLQKLKKWNADLQVVVAFKILPKEIWDMPIMGTLNLHASYLPQYRGAAPINWAIINGETQTGISAFLLQEGIDTGSILLREKVNINAYDTAGSLQEKLEIKGANLLVKTINLMALNKINPILQQTLNTEKKILKKAPKINKKDCQIEWYNTLEDIYNHIRGLNPTPTAFTYLVHKNGNRFRLKIYDITKQEKIHSINPKTIITDDKTFIHIAVIGGFIQLETLQMEGKKKLTVKNFLNGCKISSYIII